MHAHESAVKQKADWFAEFRRRMFRAMVAYFVGAWLLLQIASVTFPPLGLWSGCSAR
jgi:hypothetical protein